MRISKWRCGALALPVIPVRPITSPCGDRARHRRRTGTSARRSRCCRRRRQVDGVATRALVRDVTHGARLHRDGLGADRHEHVDAGVPARAAVVVGVRRAGHRARRTARHRAGDDLPGARPPLMRLLRRLQRGAARPRAPPCGPRRRCAAAISASYFAWSVGDRLLDVGERGLQARGLASSCVGDLACCCSSCVELGLLVLEVGVDRRQLLHASLSVWFAWSISCCLTDRRHGVVGADRAMSMSLPLCVYANSARCRAMSLEHGGARLLLVDRVLQLGDVVSASPRPWSCSGTRRRLVAPACRASASFWLRGFEVVAVAAPAAPAGSAGTQDQCQRRERGRERRKDRAMSSRIDGPGLRGNASSRYLRRRGRSSSDRGIAAVLQEDLHADVRTARTRPTTTPRSSRTYSAEILELHHDKHHAGLRRRREHHASRSSARPATSGDFGTINQLEKNLAFHLSGHVLHSLFWKNLSPDGGGEPEGELAAAVDECFGVVRRLPGASSPRRRMNVQGSGWGALVVGAARPAAHRRAGLRPPGQRRAGRAAAPRARHVGARLLPAVQEREGRLGRRPSGTSSTGPTSRGASTT